MAKTLTKIGDELAIDFNRAEQKKLRIALDYKLIVEAVDGSIRITPADPKIRRRFHAR